MRIYEITSSQWETDEYVASEQAARKRGAEMRRKNQDFQIGRIEFTPTKKTILKMLNREGYADLYEVVAEYDPPMEEYNGL